jgi:thioredoxin-like negative regulator of GroEL
MEWPGLPDDPDDPPPGRIQTHATLAHEAAHLHFREAIGLKTYWAINQQIRSFNEDIAEAVEVATLPDDVRKRRLKNLARHVVDRLNTVPDDAALWQEMADDVEDLDYRLAVAHVLAARDLRPAAFAETVAPLTDRTSGRCPACVAQQALQLVDRPTLGRWAARQD